MNLSKYTFIPTRHATERWFQRIDRRLLGDHTRTSWAIRAAIKCGIVMPPDKAERWSATTSSIRLVFTPRAWMVIAPHRKVRDRKVRAIVTCWPVTPDDFATVTLWKLTGWWVPGDEPVARHENFGARKRQAWSPS